MITAALIGASILGGIALFFALIDHEPPLRAIGMTVALGAVGAGLAAMLTAMAIDDARRAECQTMNNRHETENTND